MEYRLELRKSLKDQQSLGRSQKTILPQAIPRSNPQDRFRREKPNLSYADLHHEITKNVKDISSKPLESHLRQQIDREVNKEDELVKHMSNLPSYLERGENLQEKVLNVGVLDWGRLEKWQYIHKQLPHRSRRPSVSSSNTSSSFSTDESSAYSSRGQSWSPAHQRLRHPSLQFHLTSSSMEARSQVDKMFGEGVGKIQDLKGTQQNTFKNQVNLIRAGQPFSLSHAEIKLGQCKRKDSDLKAGRETGTLPNRINCEVASHAKERQESQGDELVKRPGTLNEQNQVYHEHDVHKKEKAVVILLPRDRPPKSLSEVKFPDSAAILGRKGADASGNLLEGSKVVCHLECNLNLPDSCSSPHEAKGNRHMRIKRNSLIDADMNNLLTERSNSVPRSSKIGISPSIRNQEDKGPAAIPTKFNAKDEPSRKSDLKLNKVASEKGRSTSPFRRLSFSMGKTSKSSSSKDVSALPQSSSMNISAKPGSENIVALSCHNATRCDKPHTANRARSSPLRRLLEPLIKPKAVNCHNLARPLSKDPKSCDGASRLSDEQPCSSTGQSGKDKLEMANHRALNADYPSQSKRRGLSTVQALLRVAVKNGQPLFTFAVDNETDILAATMKKLNSSGKDDYSYIYTFFTIQEVTKRKGRWIKQGDKGQGHDYIPNVVAQLRVSGSQPSNLTGRNCIDQFRIREFVLFAVDLGQADQQTSDFHPKDELAAIVVKIPKRISRSSSRDLFQSGKSNDSQEVGLKEYLSEESPNSISGKDIPNCSLVYRQDISATVILPSGTHSLPHKGGPSSLIQRWKSGGVCDCGGWDMGCKLKILANQNQPSKNFSLSKLSSATDQFELFFLGGLLDNQPFFSFAPFQDGIYSVEFNSSLSLLQAFAICIAVWDGKQLCKISELSDSIEDKTLQETIRVQRNSSLVDGDAPAKYISNPPLSPVGRV